MISQLLRRKDIREEFVHDTLTDYFLAEYFAAKNVDVTQYIEDKKIHKTLCFYAGMIDDGTDLVKKIMIHHKLIDNSGESLLEKLSRYYESIESIEFLLFVSNCILEANYISEEINKTKIGLDLLDAVANFVILLNRRMPGEYGSFMQKIEDIFSKLAYENKEVIERAKKYCDGIERYDGYGQKYIESINFPISFLVNIAGDNEDVFDYVRNFIKSHNDERRREAIESLAKAVNPRAVEILLDVIDGKYGHIYFPDRMPESTREYTLESLASSKCPKAAEAVERLIQTGSEAISSRDYFALFFSDRNLRKKGIFVSKQIRDVIEKYKREDKDDSVRWLLSS